MRQRPESLPDYSDPPIDEVVISVQFAPIQEFLDSNTHDFWRTVRENYPIAQNQPRIESPIESVEETPTSPMIQFQIPLASAAQGRMWLISDSDDFLIQVQNSRFTQNWRRRQAPYQHFELLHEMFWENFLKFRTYLDGAGLTQPVIQQAELSYINWIPASSLPDFFQPASGSRISVLGTQRTPDDQSWSGKYTIPNDLDMIQRLYVQCQPAMRTQSPFERGTQLAFVSRNAREGGIEDSQVRSVFDLARIMIVEAFAELTTESAQRTWGRLK